MMGHRRTMLHACSSRKTWQQMPLEVRPAHDPSRAYGFVGVVVSLEDLSASIWLWEKGKGSSGWSIRKGGDDPCTAS